MPARYSEHFSSSFAHIISSNEEPNILSSPSSSEPKSSSISYVLPSETNEILAMPKT